MTVDHRISLRSRLLVVVAVLAVVLLGVTILAAVVAGSMSGAVDQRLAVIYPAASALGKLRPTVIDLETGERGYVITGEASFLEPYTTGRGEITAAFATLRGYERGIPGLEAAIDAAQADLAAWQTDHAEPEIAAVQRGDRAAGVALIRAGEGKSRFDVVRSDLDAVQATIDQASEANRVRTQSDQRSLRNVLVAGLVAVAALIVALMLLLTRWVTRPTSQLVESVGVVAGGDFREMVDVDGPPEFAAIGAAVDRMRQRILAELDELERYNEALEQTGPVVQSLRAELEPQDFAPRTGVEVAGCVLAAEGLLAGDFYDLVDMPGGRFAMLVADVSGHGHEAGVLAIRFKFLVEAALQLGFDPSASLAWAAERLGDTGTMFLTCALVVVDRAARRVSYASAGHSPGVLLVGADDEPIVLESTGPLIGPFPGAWRTDTHTFGEATTTIVLCSDGLIEARASADELFGFERFVAIVRAGGTMAELVDRCCVSARDHAGERLADDLTLVAVRIEGTDQIFATP